MESIKGEIIQHKKKLNDFYKEREIYNEKLHTVNDDIDKLYTKRGIDISEGATNSPNKSMVSIQH